MVGIPKRLHATYWSIFFLLGLNSAFGQDLYWISFTDKGDLSEYTADEILSQRALENRRQKGIVLDALDYPLNPDYVKGLQMKGVRIKNRSRWFNAVSAFLFDEEIGQILNLPFIKSIKPVARGLQTVSYDSPLIDPFLSGADSLPFVGEYRNQLNMLGLDTLQGLGFTGTGIKVAVFDNGFYGVEEGAAFAHLFEENKVLATRDFVDGDQNVFEPCIHCRHGTEVLSAMVGMIPDQIQGSAPGATYILLRTENDASEISPRKKTIGWQLQNMPIV